MSTLGDLDADALRQVMITYRDALRSHQEVVNRLNVYPVPDGDTGTNMALTLESVVAELPGGPSTMAPVCQAIAHGSLMGARGNSGVILSQILRGWSDVLSGGERAGPVEVASALTASAAAAYEAVMRPVEGTILTVARESAVGAEEAAGAGKALVDVLDAAKDAGADALARTPELLPVLAEAGVVDAGGSGYLLLLDAALAVVAGRPLPVPAPVPAGVGVAAVPRHDAGDLRFEVMYLLEAPDEAIPAFRDVWAGIGDSIVVVGGAGIWNCHIHTDDVGAAIEVALDAGRPRNIRVTDLHEQVEEERWVREAAAEGEMDAEPPHVHEPVATAVVAVGTGPGIRRIFYSLGVQQIVAGGQSMNPSTAQLLDAVSAAPAGAVVILPNNKNIIPVAEQVVDLSVKEVRVVPTTGIAEGFAALIDYDPEASAAENAEAMAAAARRVVAGEVTRAVRASSCDLGAIAEGDWIGLSRRGIDALGTELAATACALLDRLVADGHEIVTIIEGEGATAGDTRRITEWLAEHRPAVAAEVHHGGQPLYPYLFGVE